MAKFRYTIKQLEEFDDFRMIKCAIIERQGDLGPYSPLRKRLDSIDVDSIRQSVELFELILNTKQVLPVLIGLNDELDKLIEERLRS